MHVTSRRLDMTLVFGERESEVSKVLKNISVFALGLAVLVLVALPAMAMKRVALVIGNNAYESVAPLEKAVNDASQAYFSRPAMYMGCGGTIPFMKMLGDAYPDVQFMVTGVLGPKSNAHGPNEFLEIATGKRVTACVASVLADHAGR